MIDGSHYLMHASHFGVQDLMLCSIPKTRPEDLNVAWYFLLCQSITQPAGSLEFAIASIL
jgi:hypothetical protein